MNIKVAKKNLRSAQRQQEACLRKNRYDDIMSAKEGNQKLFHKLVADQCKDGTVKTTHLIVQGEQLTSEKHTREGWANYFKELSTPGISQNADLKYNTQVTLDHILIEDLLKSSKKESIVVDFNEVEETVAFLKNGKAADYDSMNITSERLKFGGSALIYTLTCLINMKSVNYQIFLDLELSLHVIKGKENRYLIQIHTGKLLSLVHLGK